MFIHDHVLLNNLAYSKVANLDFTLRCQQNIVKFNISVKHAILVDMLDARNNLLKQELRNILFQLMAFAHIRQQVTAPANLHDKHDVLWSLD